MINDTLLGSEPPAQEGEDPRTRSTLCDPHSSVQITGDTTGRDKRGMDIEYTLAPPEINKGFKDAGAVMQSKSPQVAAKDVQVVDKNLTSTNRQAEDSKSQ